MRKSGRSKLLAVILSVMTAVMLMPAYAAADDANTPQNTEWTSVGSAAELNEALQSGGNIKLSNNISGAQITVPADVTAVIDLFGNTIDRGMANAAINGSAILVKGNLTVRDSDPARGGMITGGWTNGSGGGVRLEEGASFTLEGGRITNCVATGSSINRGGGVFVSKNAEFIMEGGEISACAAGTGTSVGQTSSGGGGVAVSGRFIMNGGRIYNCGIVNDGNRSSSADYGGAVYVSHDAEFIMSGGQLGIAGTGNKSNKAGGAVYVAPGNTSSEDKEEPGSFEFKGGAIIEGEAREGAGVFNAGSFSMKEGAGINNSLSGESVCNKGVFTMSGGSISNVSAANDRCGVKVDAGGLFDMSGGELSGNHGTYGGGVFVNGGEFNMSGGSIKGNSATAAGGGVYIADNENGHTPGGSFNMSGGSIEGNTAEDDCGGGVWVGNEGSFNMSRGAIEGNHSGSLSTASGDSENRVSLGGGVFVKRGGSFSLSGPVRIQNNTVGTSDFVSNVKLDGDHSASSVDRSLVIVTGPLGGASVGITPDTTDGSSSCSGDADSFIFKDGPEDNIFTKDFSSESGGVYPSEFFTPDVSEFSAVRHVNGEARLQKHVTHTCTYKAEGNKLTAKCGLCGAEASMELNAAGGQYNGNVYSASFDGLSAFNELTRKEVSEASIEYYSGSTKLDAAPAASGAYTAKYTLSDGGNNYTITKDFTISAVPVPPADDSSKDDKAGSQEPGAAETDADAAITSAGGEKDIAGSAFGLLKAKSTKQTKNSVTITWSKIKGAKSYVVYGNMCNSKGVVRRMTRLASVSGKSLKVKKLADGKKLKKGTYYKFVVMALDKNNKVVSVSKTIHAATQGGRFGNHKSVKVSKSVIKKAKKLKKGKSLRVNAGAVKDKLKVRLHTKAVRYETSNAKVASVSAGGRIKGVSKGSCYVYAYAQNGVCKRIRVTVK